MELFLDTANIDEIREVNSWGVISGVTTNPTLCAKEGREFTEVIKEIAEIVSGPISAEVISPDAKGMIAEAKELSKIADNVIIKMPMTSEALAATSVVSKEGIRVNMTLIFSVNQAILAALAGASYASIFLGRLDDIGQSAMSVLIDAVAAYRNYDFDTKIIAASVRNPIHVTDSALAGAAVATVPYSVIKQMVGHPLTDRGIDAFLLDWEKLKDKLSK